jgi:hypothetical protein
MAVMGMIMVMVMPVSVCVIVRHAAPLRAARENIKQRQCYDIPDASADDVSSRSPSFSGCAPLTRE